MSEMVEEMKSLKKNQIWELVHLLKGIKFIGCKWVLKIKPTIIEKVGEDFKARLVANGYFQNKGIDYDEIFSWIFIHTSIREMLDIVTSWDMYLEKMDMKTTFFHNNLNEQIYTERAKGISDTGHGRLVRKLKRSLYSLN